MQRKKLPEERERMIHVRLTVELHKSLKMEVAHKGKTIQDGWETSLKNDYHESRKIVNNGRDE